MSIPIEWGGTGVPADTGLPGGRHILVLPGALPLDGEEVVWLRAALDSVDAGRVKLPDQVHHRPEEVLERRGCP